MQKSIVFLLRVCRRKENSRSLSHLLMSFLFWSVNTSYVNGNARQLNGRPTKWRTAIFSIKLVSMYVSFTINAGALTFDVTESRGHSGVIGSRCSSDTDALLSIVTDCESVIDWWRTVCTCFVQQIRLLCFTDLKRKPVYACDRYSAKCVLVLSWCTVFLSDQHGDSCVEFNLINSVLVNTELYEVLCSDSLIRPKAVPALEPVAAYDAYPRLAWS